ncbi:MAG TPA: secondary thiamine-phosphate synthase enzyme YjbQ [Bacteriovoracaceae bacterium]|nr:secondary thiamine-phosphate synthase enzyme YjbQ [Bacteriovoracaceae bacterium]
MSVQIHHTLKAYPKGFHLITDEIQGLLKNCHTGVVHIFIQHTSAALSINENADPSVRHDLNLAFDKLAPENMPYYEHTLEGPDDMPAHIKSIIAGSSVTIPIFQGKLSLGTWQGIYLCEFRNQGGPRKIVITLL